MATFKIHNFALGHNQAIVGGRSKTQNLNKKMKEKETQKVLLLMVNDRLRGYFVHPHTEMFISVFLYNRPRLSTEHINYVSETCIGKYHVSEKSFSAKLLSFNSLHIAQK